jgi:hypothetical protein
LSIFTSPVWAKLAVARRVQQAAVARERRNMSESLFLGELCVERLVFDKTLMTLDSISEMMLNGGGWAVNLRRTMLG